MSIDPGRCAEVLFAAFAIWAVRAAFWPFAKCRRCSGTGRSAGSTSRRWGKCWRCGGSGQRQVLGSKRLHRAVLAARGRARRKRPADR